ncbi:hypothetical protein GGS24DRAFT_500491 [Hypoxylon argillaceum]|nr:hypothetical protein GGS24DRAFT_500491 [Hypoxylon argillaceum]KAI1154264.1 hypothetical protein F4825DRAFT_448742 [Nemania diffusa]
MTSETDVISVEERIITTVHTFMEVVFRLRSSLAAIERNTGDLFWWTSWSIIVVLGLFILHLLIRVRTQLVTLNGYQSTFQRMWVEDRAKDDRIRMEESQRERREREMMQMRGVALSPEEAAEMAESQAFLDDVRAAVGFIPNRGNPVYQDWLEEMRDMMNNDEEE